MICAIHRYSPEEKLQFGALVGTKGRLEKAKAALAAMRAHPLGRQAAITGEVRAEPAGMVFLRTDIGGIRVLDMLVGDPLPLITLPRI